MSNDLKDLLTKDVLDFFRKFDEVEFKREYLGEFPQFPSLVYVVSRSYQMARMWAEEKGCPRESFVYVSDRRVLERHSTGGYIAFSDSWDERKDAHQIIDVADYLIKSGRLKHFDDFFDGK